LDFIQNADDYSYFYKSSDFNGFFGVRFQNGTLFFKYNRINYSNVTVAKQSELPTVRVKKVQKPNNWFFKDLFVYRGENVGYEWRVTQIEKFFEIENADMQKLYCIFRNHQYGWMFFLDGKREEIKTLYKKFEGEIPQSCDLSSYEGDVVLHEVKFY
jgi:hypothetical protein